MSAVAIILGAVLAALAALHGHWAFGGVWPARDEASLIRAAIGEPGRRRMPGRALSLAVAACLMGAAATAVLARWPSGLPDRLFASAAMIFAVVFLGRGVAGFTPAWRRAHSAEPFARLDRIAYSPLCLALGGGFVLPAAERWSAQ